MILDALAVEHEVADIRGAMVTFSDGCSLGSFVCFDSFAYGLLSECAESRVVINGLTVHFAVRIIIASDTSSAVVYTRACNYEVAGIFLIQMISPLFVIVILVLLFWYMTSQP